MRAAGDYGTAHVPPHRCTQGTHHLAASCPCHGPCTRVCTAPACVCVRSADVSRPAPHGALAPLGAVCTGDPDGACGAAAASPGRLLAGEEAVAGDAGPRRDPEPHDRDPAAVLAERAWQLLQAKLQEAPR
jgi:hypothetical protein